MDIFHRVLTYLKNTKNQERLWFAYTELQGGFYMLQLISFDSRHFIQPELSLGWSDLHEIKSVRYQKGSYYKAFVD